MFNKFSVLIYLKLRNWFLNLFYKIISLASLKKECKKKSILVFRSAALGDFIISLPALKLLRGQYPDYKIVLLTIQSATAQQRVAVARYAGAPGSMPWTTLAMPHLVDDVIILHSLKITDLLKHLRPQIRELDPEFAVLLTDPGAPGLGVVKKLLLLRFLGVRGAIYGWHGFSTLSRFRRQQFEAGLYRHHVLGPVAAVLECPNMQEMKDASIEFDIAVPDSASDWVSDYWYSHNLDKHRVIALAPGSIQSHKRWPIEQFEALCRQLLTQADVRIIVIGTPADKELGHRLCNIDTDRVFNLAGVTSIPQSAALLKRCTLLVGNDGGAMHLGDAVGCAVVSIVPGIEYPDSIEPWHNKHRAVRHQIDCAPCYNFVSCPLGHNRCMTELPLKAVWLKSVEALAEKSSAALYP